MSGTATRRTSCVVVAIFAAQFLLPVSAIACDPGEQWNDKEQPWKRMSQSDRRQVDQAAERITRIFRPKQDALKSTAVGRIEVQFKRDGATCALWCTGFLIGEAHVMTAHHCIPGLQPNDQVVAAQIRLGYVIEPFLGTATGQRVDERVYALFEKPEDMGSDEAMDFSIVRIKNPDKQLKLYGTMNLFNTIKNDRPRMNAIPLEIVHHPQGATQRYSGNCYYTNIGSNEVFNHDCATFTGSSGAPVIDVETRSVIGMHRMRDEGNAILLAPIIAKNKLLASLVAKRTDTPPLPSFEGTYVFLGRASAVEKLKDETDYSNDAPFGGRVIKWLMLGNTIEGQALVVPNMVSVRKLPPNMYGTRGAFVATLFHHHKITFKDHRRIVSSQEGKRDEAFYGEIHSVESLQKDIPKPAASTLAK